MIEAARAAKDLVIANRILAHEGLVDAFGDVSVRHPVDKDRFFLACGRSPGAVIPDDVGDMGLNVPVWDIAEKFGEATSLQVSTFEQGRDLARCLGRNRVVLLRGE